VRVWWFLLRVVRATALLFAAELVCATAYFGLPLVIGLVTRVFFDTISGHAPAGLNAWTALAVVLVLQLARSGTLAGLEITVINLRYGGSALLRANLLHQLLLRPGALPLPDSPGEAISRFRDDAESVMYEAIDCWVDLIGRSVFVIAAFAVMISIDAPLAAAVAAMLALSVPVIILAGDRIATYVRLNHEAIGRMTGFLAEMFSGVQAIKAAGATDPVVAHFRKLGERRRRAAVRDQLWQAVVTAVDANVVTFGIGLVLLLGGQKLRAGAFTVGDFSLFVVYLTDLMWFPDEIARFVTSYRQAGVALDRMTHLLGGGDWPSLTEALPGGERRSRGTSLPEPGGSRLSSDIAIGSVGLGHVLRERPPGSGDGLLLETRGLTYSHPSSGRGVAEISFGLEAGSLVVLTGRVASGKTTLLQVLLGLLPRDSGEIFWLAQPVVDPRAFFGPPRTSYLPQAPRLFSESLRANVEQGWAAEDAWLGRVTRLAVLERDLATLPEGLETVIGARGARLSGGQVQRAAAARAFLRAPELLVLDDLSSALDLPTEEILWERLAEWRRESPGLTILAVSHRQAALQRADRVLVMEEGRIVEEG
jgi:ATP-binding cassette subfamily B protein